MTLTARKILKHTLLPGLLPRARDLFTTGFSHIATFMAFAYGRVGLLPPNHPFLAPANAGRFGIRQVMTDARRNLVFRRENTDQVIIYYTVLLGIFLLFFQAAMLVLSLTVHAAMADSSVASWYGKFLVTPSPSGDIAFILLDLVFGFKGIYGSCADPSIACPDMLKNLNAGSAGWPTPIQTALHTFLNFYDLGIAIVGFVIFLYLIVTVVAETAQTGNPFGRRYSHWVPVRLILAIGLIAPFASGINGAQTGALYIAKWGSSLATNGWVLFNTTLTEKDGTMTPMGMPDNLVVNPVTPDINNLLEFMMVAKTCLYAEKYINGRTIKPYQISGTAAPEATSTGGTAAATEWDMPSDFTQALSNSKNHDIVLRFGELSTNKTDYAAMKGGVSPVCGEITLKVKDVGTTSGNQDGGFTVQSEYYTMLVDLWNDGQNDGYGMNIAKRHVSTVDKDPSAPLPDASYLSQSVSAFQSKLEKAIADGRAAEQSDPRWMQNFTTLGWGGAAIWYNKIAEYNGSFVSASFNLPAPSLYPDVMEYVQEERRKAENSLSANAYNPMLSNHTMIPFRKAGESDIATALYAAHTIWKDQYPKPTGNVMEDTINALFGLSGLFNMQHNATVHPLAQLVGIGRSLIENCISKLSWSAGTAAVSLLSSSTLPGISGAAGTVSTVTLEIAMTSIMVGFFLFYVIPFMPFIYFFFALSSWVKTVFEAMVGLPLWAISFIRIEGEGLAGPGARNGYYLLLDIFLRPVLIVVGLIASIGIFAAEVMVLSQVWSLVVANVSGNTPTDAASLSYLRESIDQFFYTVMYGIVVYLLALNSFKLIDLIPSRILRWISGNVAIFSGGGEAEGFMGTMVGVTQQVEGSFQGGGAVGMLLRRN